MLLGRPRGKPCRPQGPPRAGLRRKPELSEAPTTAQLHRARARASRLPWSRGPALSLTRLRRRPDVPCRARSSRNGSLYQGNRPWSACQTTCSRAPPTSSSHKPVGRSRQFVVSWHPPATRRRRSTPRARSPTCCSRSRHYCYDLYRAQPPQRPGGAAAPTPKTRPSCTHTHAARTASASALLCAAASRKPRRTSSRSS